MKRVKYGFHGYTRGMPAVQIHDAECRIAVSHRNRDIGFVLDNDDEKDLIERKFLLKYHKCLNE